jgi:hypothetical protein
MVNFKDFSINKGAKIMLVKGLNSNLGMSIVPQNSGMEGPELVVAKM